MTTSDLKPLLEDPTLPSGWKRIVSQRTSGDSAGKWDVYITGLGKRFRSRPELERFLEKNQIQDIRAQDIDFTIWGRGVKPQRSPTKPRSAGPGSEDSQPDGGRKKTKRVRLPTDNEESQLATSSAGCGEAFYVKFKFRPPKRSRQNSEVSVDLEESCCPRSEQDLLTGPEP